jgi:hypothetical protein
MKSKQFLNRKEITKCYCSQLESGPKPKMARRPAHAQRALHARPHRGPGPGKLFPTWAVTRSGNREPSIYIQRPDVESGQTKTSSAPSREPYGSFGLLHAVPRRSSSRDGIAAGPLADARTRRWVDAPPSSGSSAEPYPRTRASERLRSSVDERRRGGWCRRKPSRWCVRLLMGGRIAVKRLLGRALPARPWRVPSPQPRVAVQDLPMRRVAPSTAGGSGHGISTKG